MNKFKKSCICLLCVLLLVLSACRNAAAGIHDPIRRIALITGTQELELDFINAALWEGIGSCGDANGIEYVYYRPSDMTDEAISAQFNAAVQEGAQVVICYGDRFSHALAGAQKQYPGTRFIVIDASEESIGKLEKNTHCVMFRQEQGGYLAGYAAVKDGFARLGYLGERNIEAFANYGYGFVQGASDAAMELSAEIEINVAFADEYENEDAALSELNEWYASGTEVVMVCANDALTQKCAEKAVSHLQYIIGSQYDQAHLGSYFDYNPFMTSAMQGLREAVDATLEMLLSGSWEENLGGKTLYFGLQNGNYVYLPDYVGLWLFKDFTLADYEQIKEKIAGGTVQVGSADFPAVDDQYVTLRILHKAE
ncbi:MAG: BMP family ABC transporter substrate-binding protein [Clostridia bacterium]|nr:BMP family ABC transporter substrate-binding protein [Clostridia bacterium]